MEDVLEKLCMVCFNLINGATAHVTNINIEADGFTHLIMYNKHAVGLWEESTEPGEIFGEIM